MTNLAQKFEEGEAKEWEEKWKEQCKIDPKVQFLSIFLPILRIRGEKWWLEKCKGRVLMFQRQIRKLPL